MSQPDSRISAKKPLVVLCQHAEGSCGACCGVYNFVDNGAVSFERRLQRRTERVLAAWPDVGALAAVRDALLEEERADVLFAAVKVCPFAGYVEPSRVGCLLHPTRHPEGHDLRDLAVYPRAVCEGHFCAPHDWLRPREVALAQTVRGVHYGRIVTDAGLVKALVSLLDESLGRPFAPADVTGGDVREACTVFWRCLASWPYKDENPRRFGGFVFDGDDAIERTLPSSVAGLDVDVPKSMVVVFDALGTRSLDRDEAAAAVELLTTWITALAQTMTTARAAS